MRIPIKIEALTPTTFQFAQFYEICPTQNVRKQMYDNTNILHATRTHLCNIVYIQDENDK